MLFNKNIKVNKAIVFALLTFICLTLVNCKTHRDCRGRKKTAKTAMGGWI